MYSMAWFVPDAYGLRLVVINPDTEKQHLFTILLSTSKKINSTFQHIVDEIKQGQNTIEEIAENI